MLSGRAEVQWLCFAPKVRVLQTPFRSRWRRRLLTANRTSSQTTAVRPENELFPTEDRRRLMRNGRDWNGPMRQTPGFSKGFPETSEFQKVPVEQHVVGPNPVGGNLSVIAKLKHTIQLVRGKSSRHGPCGKLLYAKSCVRSFKSCGMMPWPLRTARRFASSTGEMPTYCRVQLWYLGIV